MWWFVEFEQVLVIMVLGYWPIEKNSLTVKTVVFIESIEISFDHVVEIIVF